MTKTERFIEKAGHKHKMKYDYSIVEYTHSLKKIKIICPEHGVFEQPPGEHLSGRNCPKCARITRATKIITMARNNFIKRAVDKHGTIYDYTKTQYNGVCVPIKIICSEHGEFQQTPSNHIQGRGCPKCAISKQTKTTNQFINESRLTHEYEYDYSEVQYTGAHQSVQIKCKKHGVFNQIARCHSTGTGCPKCHHEQCYFDSLKKYTLNETLGAEPGIFYKLKFKHKSGFEFLKVGITSKTIKNRYKYKCYENFTYEIIEMIKCTNLESAMKEKEFIYTTKAKKFKFPEGIIFNGHSECYEI